MKVQIRNSKLIVSLFVLLSTIVTNAYAIDGPTYGQPYAYGQSYQLNAIGASTPFQMQSTSLLIGNRSAVSTGMTSSSLFGARSSRAYGGQVSPISFFSSKDSKKRSWARDNFRQAEGLMRSGSTYASTSAADLNSGGAPSGPRRVSGDQNDPDPFMGEPVPVGETPYVLLALMMALYVFVNARRKQTVCR